MSRQSKRVIDDENSDDGDYAPGGDPQTQLDLESSDLGAPRSPRQQDEASGPVHITLEEYSFTQLSSRDQEVASSYGLVLCKAAMAAELKNQVITKGYISKHVLGDDRGLKLNYIFKYAQRHLSTIGMELVPLPAKDQKEADVTKLGHSLNSSYVVKSNLPDKFQQVIGDYFIRRANDEWEIPNSFGTILLIICCIALHKNNISKKELELITLKFGVSDKVHEELMKKAIREEYVLEERIGNGERRNGNKRRRRGNEHDDDFVHYHIGRRTRVEFPKEKMIQLLQDVYGKKYLDEQKAAVSLNWW